MKECLRNIPGYISYLWRGYFVPKEIEEAREDNELIILHLSDTPSFAYRSLIGLIEALKPGVVIHTGDLADDFKLELHPNLSAQYRETVRPFLRALEDSAAGDIYIVPGNHDLENIIREEAGRIHVVPVGQVIDIEGRKLGLAHCWEDLPAVYDYGLYGHNLAFPGDKSLSVLNGCRTINIILSPSWRIFHVPYPVGTNHERKYNTLNGRLP